jgi:surfactin synthase thioesterase subunit
VLDKLIVTPRPQRGPAVRLIAVPYAGGGVSAFRGWQDRLPVSEVSIVELPGRGGRLREPLLQSLPQAAADVAEAIVRQPGHPTVLFGHGVGALIAFEAARRLRDRGWPLLALFVSGRRGPGLPESLSPIAHLAIEQFLPEVSRRYGTMPGGVLSDPEVMPLTVPALRADLAMLESYRYVPAAPLECPIVACGGMADPLASRAELDAWRLETRGRFSVHTFRGGHFFLEEERDAVTALIANQTSVLVGAMTRGMGLR